MKPRNTPPLRPASGVVPMAALLFVMGCSGSDTPQVNGILEWDRVELPAEISEPIVEFYADEGDRLESGRKILQLDPRRTEAMRDEAAAAREQAAARLAELKRGPRSERIDEAQARLRGAQSTLETARTEFQRVEKLVERRLSTPEAVDEARARRDRALAERDAARAALAELLTGATVEQLQQADAALKQADANLRRLEVSLQRLTVRAPGDGVLDVLPFNLGAQPRAGETVAVVLSGRAPYARVYVPEPIRARVKQGTPAQVHIDGLDKPFKGHVRMISRDAAFTPYYSLTEKDRSRLSYVAEIALEGGRVQTLTSGMPVQVEFPATESDD